MTRTPVRYMMVFCVSVMASVSVWAAAKVAEEEATATAVVKSNVQEVATEKAAPPAEAKGNSLNGNIEATDVKASTITIRHKKQSQTFTVAPDCEVIGAQGKKVTLADLVIGERVKVKYTTQDGDQLVAHHIGHVDKKKTEKAQQAK